MPVSRLYRALLKLFPREFRGDFGDQMEADFEDQREEVGARRGRAAVAALWMRTTADMLRRGPAEHLDMLRRDAGYAIRLLRRQPGFAVAVVLTLAIGVGSTTAVFTLADPMLFRPLPYPDSDRIVELSARANDHGRNLHGADLLQMRASHGGFEAIATFGVAHVGGRLAGTTEEPFGYQVTRGFFDVLRVRPFLGREFLAGEYQVAAAGDAVILTHRFWQSAYGGRADVLGRTMELEGFSSLAPRRFRIVGIMPSGFVLPDDVNHQPDFFLAYEIDPAIQGNPNRLVWPIARLGHGATVESVRAEMTPILRAVEQQFPRIGRNREAGVRSLREGLFGPVRTPLLMLLGATGCVLLLACANLAHLFMARLHARQREFGVRLALGASSGRLVRLLMMEATMLAVAGGAVSLVLARWTFDLLMSRTPEFAHIYRLLPAELDMRVAAFAAALVGAAVVIFGGLPALGASRVDIRGSLLDGGTSKGGGRTLRSDGALLFLQCAVALTLLVGGALLVRSFYNLAYQPLGFAPDHIREVYVAPPDGRAPADAVVAAEQRRRIYEHLRERLPVPVTVTNGLPAMTLPASIGRIDAAPGAAQPVAYPAADTAFEVLGVQLLSGRLYDRHEAFGNAPAVVVDRLAAEHLWPGEDPIGKEVVDSRKTARKIIGVVETLRTSLTRDRNDSGTAFIPFAATDDHQLSIRDPGNRVSLAQLRAAVDEVIPGAMVVMRPFRPFERTLGQPRFLALLLGTLGLVTVALTIVGVFGVVNHGTVRRTREMGIRLSLGANAGGIRRLVLRRALVPAVSGIAVGAGVSLWWTPVLESLLFDLQPNDLGTFITAGALVVATVLLASAPPAWRASRVDPMVALRE